MQLTLDGASSVSADEQQISRSFGKKRQHNEREKRRKRLQQYQIRPQICRACNYRNTIAIISSTHASRGTPFHAERKQTTNGSTENAGPEIAGQENAGSGVEGPFYRAGKYRTEKKTKKRADGNWRTTVAHIIKENTHVPDVQKLCWEKQRESIKSHDEHFTQTR